MRLAGYLLGGRESFALGVWFATDRNVLLRSNYDERIVKIKMSSNYGNLGGSPYWEKSLLSKVVWFPILFTF